MAQQQSPAISSDPRADGRGPDQLRTVRFQNHIAPYATGSTLIEWGNTRVICGVTVEESVPRWMKEQGVTGGWITAEYSMLPYSTLQRKQRDITKGKIDGRSQEIQRLIGRAMRAALDLEKLGSRTIWVDCDVLQADGGTRTAAITGAYVAMALATRKLVADGKLPEDPLRHAVAAVSVGILEKQPLLDLCYTEDAAAEVDLNLVMTAAGEFIELQGTGEEATFSQAQLADMLALGKSGDRVIARLAAGRPGRSVKPVKYLHLIWSNLKRKKLRTILTLLSIVVAFILFGFLSPSGRPWRAAWLWPVRTAWWCGTRFPSSSHCPSRIRRASSASRGWPPPRTNPGLAASYQDPKNFFPQMPVVPEEFLDMYPEFLLPPEQKQAWLADPYRRHCRA